MMLNPNRNIDQYFTIADIETTEIKIKGSRFISFAYPIRTKEDVAVFLDNLKSRYHDATHHCYAYKIGADGLEFRAVDDGEPSGTAGKPILFSISKYNFSDVLVVVIRYFGGVKLGVGGLARAYADSANEVLAICKQKVVHISSEVKIFCTYQDIDIIKRLLNEYATSFDEIYSDAIEINARIPKSKATQFSEKITSLTKGRAGAIIKE